MKLIVYISLLISFTSSAQEPTGLRIDYVPRGPVYLKPGVALLLEELPNDFIERPSVKTHSSLKPAIRRGMRYHGRPPSRNYTIQGIADLNYFNSSVSNYPSGQYKTGLGLQYEHYINEKWYVRLAGVQGVYEADSLFQPKSYFNWRAGQSNNYTDIRSRVSYTPNHIFNFQVGLDHNFIGEGSRSMFLNDYGKPYPFGLIRARFWRLEYSVLYQFMREGEHKNWESKFASSHHISFNPASWLNIGIFETVVFQPKDTLLNRGFDAEYINPLVFYRPQEYSLGSSDNVLIGIEMSAKLKQHTIYSQFILDEFFLAEIKAHSGWWANKFGGQLGVKGRFRKGLTHQFFYRLESNFSRPFTYSHLSEELNYGNQGMPLAHIYGSNFVEVLGEFKWKHKKFGAKLFTNYSFHGSDKDGYNYGADIYQPYINRPYELGHFIGNGVQRNFMRVQVTVNYRPWKRFPMEAFAENLFMYDAQQAKGFNTIVVGFRSQLWNDYRNY